MNENENNFAALRQLLKLKQQEIPPPGYFNSFSGQVIARIRAGEDSLKTEDEKYFSEAPWLLKLLRAFEFKPAFSGAFASALCLLLVFGVVYAERPDVMPQPLLQTAGQSSGQFASVTPDALTPTTDAIGFVASNSAAGSLSPVASLFGGSQNSFATPVNFSPAGN
jgi:hypothetical protein